MQDGHEIEEHRWAEQHEGDITYLWVGRTAKYEMRPPFPHHREHLDALVEEHRQRHPHTVRQRGLLRSRLGDDLFSSLLNARRLWIDENCKRSFWVDNLIEDGEEVGRLYRFEDIHEADWFRYMF